MSSLSSLSSKLQPFLLEHLETISIPGLGNEVSLYKAAQFLGTQLAPSSSADVDYVVERMSQTIKNILEAFQECFDFDQFIKDLAEETRRQHYGATFFASGEEEQKNKDENLAALTTFLSNYCRLLYNQLCEQGDRLEYITETEIAEKLSEMIENNAPLYQQYWAGLREEVKSRQELIGSSHRGGAIVPSLYSSKADVRRKLDGDAQALSMIGRERDLERMNFGDLKPDQQVRVLEAQARVLVAQNQATIAEQNTLLAKLNNQSEESKRYSKAIIQLGLPVAGTVVTGVGIHMIAELPKLFIDLLLGLGSVLASPECSGLGAFTPLCVMSHQFGRALEFVGGKASSFAGGVEFLLIAVVFVSLFTLASAVNILDEHGYPIPFTGRSKK